MKKGFTLLELIVVIIILGILASFAIPQFINAAEKSKVGEALSLLPVINGAQMRFATADPGYTTTAAIANLDVTIPAPRNFDAPIVYATLLSDAANNRTASMRRSAVGGRYGTYTISICESGRIYCTDGNAGDCVALGQGASAAACP